MALKRRGNFAQELRLQRGSEHKSSISIDSMSTIYTVHFSLCQGFPKPFLNCGSFDLPGHWPWLPIKPTILGWMAFH